MNLVKKKVLLLVAKDGYSFINQATALSRGLELSGVDNLVIRVTDDYPYDEIKRYNPSIVVGVGSWDSYITLVKRPLEMGYKVLPWLVSDNEVKGFVDELNQLDLFLTTSEYCKEVFVKYGVKKEKISILYEAVDDNFWKEISDKELNDFIELISIKEKGIKIPENYDLANIKKNGVPILFTTGGDATNKGAQEILNALSLLSPDIDWIYIIKTWPSPGSFKRSIEELEIVIKHNMWNKVRYFSGEFSKEFIRNLMNVCDIYIACSRSEGFGLPLVEAQMCGKPVITMNATSTREVVSEGKTGMVCDSVLTESGPRANIDDLAKVLKEMLTNREKVKLMGKEAERWARSKFSPNEIAKKLNYYIDNN